MKMKRLVSAIAALAMSVSTLTAFAATAVTLDETTVTTTGTVADGVVTLTSGGNSGKDVSQNATIDLGTIEEGIVTLNFTWGLGGATGTRGRSVVAVQDDNGNDIFRYQYDGQDKDISFNGVEYNVDFARNQTRTVTAVINLYSSSVTVSGMDNDSTATFYNAAAANVGQIYFEANAKASWTNTTTLTDISYDVETQEVQYYDYAVNYKLADGTVIDSLSSAAVEGAVITAESMFEKDGVRYYITADAAPSMTVASTGENVLDVEVRVADTYTGSVVASTGTVFKEYSVVEGDSYSYSVPLCITDENGKVTAMKDVSGAFSATVTPTASENVTIAYTAYTGTAYFAENEVISDNADTTSANCSGGIATRGEDAGATAFTVAEAGIYSITVAGSCRNTNNSSTFTVYKNSVEEANLVASGDVKGASVNTILTQGTKTTTDVELAAGDVIILAGDSGQTWIDYILVEKTGDIEAPEAKIDSVVEMIKQYPESEDYEGVATALQATFTITGDASFNYVTVTCGEGSAEGAVTVVSGDGAEAVYGIVINALVEAADVTVAAAMAN